MLVSELCQTTNSEGTGLSAVSARSTMVILSICGVVVLERSGAPHPHIRFYERNHVAVCEKHRVHHTVSDPSSLVLGKSLFGFLFFVQYHTVVPTEPLMFDKTMVCRSCLPYHGAVLQFAKMRGLYTRLRVDSTTESNHHGNFEKTVGRSSRWICGTPRPIKSSLWV